MNEKTRLLEGGGDEENRMRKEEEKSIHFSRAGLKTKLRPESVVLEKNLFGNQEGSKKFFVTILCVILIISSLGIIFHQQQQPSLSFLASPLGSTAPTSIASLPMNLTLRWGIAGLGRISDDFAVALWIAGANITAVAAGSLPHPKARALKFGERFGVLPSSCYGSYEELAADPDVDIVYIGNTNQLHSMTALLMIDRFKHVLVEKPTAMTVQETKHMIATAKAKGVLFTTNFWTRYFPAIKFVKEQMSAGCIGDIVGIRGDFGFQAMPDPKDRYFNSIAGGGALMDMGCYLIQFATLAHQSVHSYKDYLKSIRSSSSSSSTSHKQSSSSSSYFDNSQPNLMSSGRDSYTRYPYEFSSLYPDIISANGLVGSDGVDVETSFLLRWKSQTLSRSLLEKDQDEEHPHRQLLSPPGIDMIQSRPSDDLSFKGLTGIFSTSLRRGSPFSVEIMGTHGFINIHDPANCPSSSVVNVGPDAYSPTSDSTAAPPSAYQFPVKSLCNQNQIGPNFFSEPLPFRPPQFGPQKYPGTTGFVYVIQAMDHCLTGKGSYRTLPLDGQKKGDREFMCLEMPELSSEEQVIIMEVIEAIQKETRP